MTPRGLTLSLRAVSVCISATRRFLACPVGPASVYSAASPSERSSHVPFPVTWVSDALPETRSHSSQGERVSGTSQLIMQASTSSAFHLLHKQGAQSSRRVGRPQGLRPWVGHRSRHRIFYEHDGLNLLLATQSVRNLVNPAVPWDQVAARRATHAPRARPQRGGEGGGWPTAAGAALPRVEGGAGAEPHESSSSPVAARAPPTERSNPPPPSLYPFHDRERRARYE